MEKKQYHANLKLLMRTCAMNYVFITRLLQNKIVGNRFEVAICDHICYGFEVISQSRYTYEVSLRQIDHSLPGWLTPSMKIRVYNDARMAEVCSSQQISYLEPSYNYPNRKMHHKNEKEQVNLFLHDWLKLCLERGYSTQCYSRN